MSASPSSGGAASSKRARAGEIVDLDAPSLPSDPSANVPGCASPSRQKPRLGNAASPHGHSSRPAVEPIETIDLISDDESVAAPPTVTDKDQDMVDKSVAAPPTAMDKDQEMVDAPPAPKPRGSSGGALASSSTSSRRAGKQPMTVDKNADAENDDVQIVDRPPPPPAPMPSGGAASSSSSSAAVEAKGPSAKDAGDDDEDVQFVGRKGDLALVDFPHSRENCMTHPFASGAAAKCANCFCFVCDAPASGCPQWDCQDKHCNATHKSAFWVAKRAAWKANGGAAVAVQGGGASSSSSSDLGAAPPPQQAVTRCSMDEILARVQQVFPIEAPDPEGFADDATLRPYQRQSLAFMLQIERSTNEALLGDRGSRGGWLCDEVGMGKTAVCAALILAHKGRDKYKPVPDAAFKNLCDPDNGSEHTYGVTIVICNNTIVQQWVDELKRFAPTLDVRTYYGGAAKDKQKTLNELRSIDVLVTTPHMVMPSGFKQNVRTHRLIIDEAHLLDDRSSSTSSKASALARYKSNYTWLVTGTPFSTGLAQLHEQTQILGQLNTGARLSELWQGARVPNKVDTFGRPARRVLSNEEVVDKLKTIMIRHTKKMRIGGELALALPSTDVTTRWLDFSDDERVLYKVHVCASPPSASGEWWTSLLDACSHLYDQQAVCGGLAQFYPPLARAIGITVADLKGQHNAYGRREVAKALGEYDPSTYDIGQFPVDEVMTEEQKQARYACVKRFMPFADDAAINKEVARREKQRIESEKLTNLRKQPREPPSIVSPSPIGAFAAACAAFKRTHKIVQAPPPKLDREGKRLVAQGFLAPPPATLPTWVPLASLSKFQALMNDLKALREAEPGFRAIVFTRHPRVQERLVKLLNEALAKGGALHHESVQLKIFEFTQKTVPQKRHALIKEFQNSTASGSRVFIVTYASAAVGITLTAANRIFLMEPCVDPSQETQACGRIQRLGQTKECFITRYCFRDSVEEAVVQLHEKILSKEIEVIDGQVTGGGVENTFARWSMAKLAHDHLGARTDTESSGKLESYHYFGEDEDVRRLLAPNGLAHRLTPRDEAIDMLGHKFSCEFCEAECSICGTRTPLPGTRRWSGTGAYAYLEGSRAEPASQIEISIRGRAPGARCLYAFARPIPRPPDGWMGLSPAQTNNGGPLPQRDTTGAN